MCIRDRLYTDIRGNLSNPEKNPPNSRLSARKYNSGNCLSFCYYVIDRLEEMGHESYMISGSCPRKYAIDGYLHVSHVAVIVPFNEGYILLDPTLYVTKPVILKYNYKEKQNILHAYSDDPPDLWEFELLEGESKDLYYSFRNSPHISIPAHTPKINVNIYDNNNNFESSFSYYIREILNPDLSITVHTNYSENRVVCVSTDEKANIKGYTNMKLKDRYFTGSIKKDFFTPLYFDDAITEENGKYIIDIKELSKWIGCSNAQCKRLGKNDNDNNCLLYTSPSPRDS